MFENEEKKMNEADEEEIKLEMPEEKNTESESKENKMLDDLKKDNEKLRAENELLRFEIKKLNDSYKQQVLEKAKQAEVILNEKIEELKLRYKNEFDTKQKYAIEKDANKLIDVINNFEFALKHSPEDPILKNYVAGFKMILGMFHTLLNDLQIHQIKITPGEMFDHNFMEVVEQIPSDRYKTNQVIEVLRPAYKLHDRVISFAKVRVAK